MKRDDAPDSPTSSELLCAEDDPGDQLIIGRIWKELTGEGPRFFENGALLLAHLERCEDERERWPRLILLDLNMPVMDGYDTLAALERHEIYCQIPVVVLSTSRQPSDVERCFSLFANGYLVKGTSMDHLRNALAKAHAFWFEKAVVPDPAEVAGEGA